MAKTLMALLRLTEEKKKEELASNEEKKTLLLFGFDISIFFPVSPFPCFPIVFADIN